jgi:hypothetical protein
MASAPTHDNAVDISAELHAAAVVDQLYGAGCRLLEKGLPVLPINGKRPCNRSGKPARAWQRVSCDAKRLVRGLLGASDPKPDWKTKQVQGSEPGIGLRMGPGSVIDIEADSDDERAAIKHLFRDVRQPKTVSYKSKRGMHCLYRYDDRLASLGKDVFKYRAADGTSVSIRIGGQKAGAQSVIPPSPGREWLPGRSFDDIEPAALPDIVIERLLEQAAAGERKPDEPERAVASESDSILLPSNEFHRLLRNTSPPAPATLPTLAVAPALAFDVLETPYDNLVSAATGSAVRDALIASVPTCYQKRHECVFAFVRRLKAIPGLRDVSRAWLESELGSHWLHPILWEWFTRGKQFFRADFDECLEDFLEGWEKVKHPWGSKLLTAYQQSLDEQLPADIIMRLGVYDCENNRRLLRLIAVLQRAAGDKAFSLDGRACASVLRIRQQAVSKKLKLFRERLHLLDRTYPGKRGRAAEYRYLYAGLHIQTASKPPPDTEAA